MIAPEAARSHAERLASGFYEKYMSGAGLDIGYRGSVPDATPVLSTAVGIDVDYPGYNGHDLPFSAESQDYVFASHTLEHVDDPVRTLREWFRVLKTGGHLVITVPHAYLYEKKRHMPSNFNADHKRFYGPFLILLEIDLALAPNSWRLRHYRDNDAGYTYDVPPELHCGGACEIECVVQKIPPPAWEIR